MKSRINIKLIQNDNVLYSSPEEGDEFEFDKDTSESKAKGLVDMINSQISSENVRIKAVVVQSDITQGAEDWGIKVLKEMDEIIDKEIMLLL